MLQETIRQIADWKIAKINDYGLRLGKSGGSLYQIGKDCPYDCCH